jgi:hypothetical protein
MSEPQPKKRRVFKTVFRPDGRRIFTVRDEDEEELPCQDCKTLTSITELNAQCLFKGCDGVYHLGQCDTCRDNAWHNYCQDCTDMFSADFSGRCDLSSCPVCTDYNLRCRNCLLESHTKCDDCGELTGETRIQCSVCAVVRRVSCCWDTCAQCDGTLCKSHVPILCVMCAQAICLHCSIRYGTCDADYNRAISDYHAGVIGERMPTCSADCHAELLDHYAAVIEQRLPTVLAAIAVDYLM